MSLETVATKRISQPPELAAGQYSVYHPHINHLWSIKAAFSPKPMNILVDTYHVSLGSMSLENHVGIGTLSVEHILPTWEPSTT